MIYTFDKNECNLIIQSTKDKRWYKHEDNFNHEYCFINETWVNEKIKKSIEINKGVILNDYNLTRIIKLKKNQKLSFHSFNYNNTSSIFKNTKFTLVSILNNSYDGGTIYMNDIKLITRQGYGIIYTIDDIQKITTIISGEMLIILSHFFSLNKNKLI